MKKHVLAFLFFVFTFFNPAHAGTAWNGTNLGSNLFATKEAACLAYAKSMGASNYTNIEAVSGSTSFRCSYGGNTGFISPFSCSTNLKTAGTVYGVQNYACSAGCPAGQVVVNGYCKPLVTCPSGQTADPETNTCLCNSGHDAGGQMAAGDVFTACMGGCKLRLYSGWYDKAANLTWGYDWKQTGDKCTPTDGEVKSPTDPKVEDAKRCPVGQCPGTQNGTSVCVPCENSKQTDKTTSSETTSDTPSGASSPASTSTKTETSDSRTSCTGDQCTTQRDVTTTNPDGSKTTKTETKTEPKSDYCTDNPKADVCKGTESSWGGECEGGFTCDGDAVQCAQAQAAHQMRCKLTETDTDAISKYNLLKSDGLSGLNLPNLTINTPTVEAFGSCPIADTTVDFGFGPVGFPLSFLCPYLEVIHRVITSFGALFWLMIVFVKGN